MRYALRMHIRSLIAAVLTAALIGAPVPSAAGDSVAPPRTKIVPRAGHAIAPLPTDAAVRKGMLAIRDLVATNHSLITHRRMPPDHALRFAAQVKVEADRILATSSLTGEARDKLHALLEEIVTGLGAVAKPADGMTAIDGLGRADAALARYPEEFDHPGWVPAQSLE
jgi:hypothetical protein